MTSVLKLVAASTIPFSWDPNLHGSRAGLPKQFNITLTLVQLLPYTFWRVSFWMNGPVLDETSVTGCTVAWDGWVWLVILLNLKSWPIKNVIMNFHGNIMAYNFQIV